MFVTDAVYTDSVDNPATSTDSFVILAPEDQRSKYQHAKRCLGSFQEGKG